jgi:hypothetical protein
MVRRWWVACALCDALVRRAFNALAPHPRSCSQGSLGGSGVSVCARGSCIIIYKLKNRRKTCHVSLPGTLNSGTAASAVFTGPLEVPSPAYVAVASPPPPPHFRRPIRTQLSTHHLHSIHKPFPHPNFPSFAPVSAPFVVEECPTPRYVSCRLPLSPWPVP